MNQSRGPITAIPICSIFNQYKYVDRHPIITIIPGVENRLKWVTILFCSAYIADICHNCHNRRCYTFFKPVPFFAQGSQKMGTFWLLCCKFTHSLVYLYRAKQCGGVPKFTTIRYFFCLGARPSQFIEIPNN